MMIIEILSAIFLGVIAGTFTGLYAAIFVKNVFLLIDIQLIYKIDTRTLKEEVLLRRFNETN